MIVFEFYIWPSSFKSLRLVHAIQREAPQSYEWNKSYT